MRPPSSPAVTFIARAASTFYCAMAACGAMAATAGAAGPQDRREPAALPAWRGTWVPDIGDQKARIRTDPTPLTPAVAAQIAAMNADEQAGRPHGLFTDCLPEGMPSWMLISHNAMEILFTPGRVTMLGESDGNRLRRIYTDGRGHPADPDPTFHGHSVGHWQGGTLVVDTVAVLPEVYIAVSESVGVPNNGGLHIVERIHLDGPDTLEDELEITAPKVLTRPWRTTRRYVRQRAHQFDIVEGLCAQGNYLERVDEHGNAVWVPVPQEDGNPAPDGH